MSMKRKIRQAYEAQKPNVLASVLQDCQAQPAANSQPVAPQKMPTSIWVDDNPKPRRELPAFWQNVWEFASTHLGKGGGYPCGAHRSAARGDGS